ncbi:MAG: hypothetical protein NTV96_06425 [Actinobacteria bacterium]|nr:hypothetical protein [Actinomycetota bacterium]MSX63953.1 hypothetical protein [Actinomycetota bacterium]
MKSKIAIGLVLLICTLTVNSPANAGEPLKKKPCSTGGRCHVGDVGPSGGYIFSIPSTPGNTTGKTFELAPRNWSGPPADPSVPWCNAATVAFTAATSTQFGTGAANTQAMLTACTSGAANTVIVYRGGGNSDWYLPSVGEAVQIMKMQSKPAINKKVGLSSYLWTSTASIFSTTTNGPGCEVCPPGTVLIGGPNQYAYWITDSPPYTANSSSIQTTFAYITFPVRPVRSF